MTARQVYEGVLIELNKVQAPSLLLEDFNYLFNKAINQYTNKRYNIYDINQQTTDDLRVLKSSCVLKANNDKPVNNVTAADAMWGAIYEFNLPKDYLHILNCICNFKVNKPFKCYDAGTYVQFGATRLTADLWSQIINNFYMRPTYKRPYYYIHNVNTDLENGGKINVQGGFGRVPNDKINVPTDPGNIDITHLKSSTKSSLYGDTYIDDKNDYISPKNGISRTFQFKEQPKYSVLDDEGTVLLSYDTYEVEEGSTTNIYIKNVVIGERVVGVINTSTQQTVYDFEDTLEQYVYSTYQYNVRNINESGYQQKRAATKTDNTTNVYDKVERAGEVRYGNNSNVRLEIRYGKDNSLFTLDSVYVDYIKAPQWIRLTQEQLDLTEDTSQMMEFPDYVCQEIINELVHLVMENSADPRLQSHPIVTQSIANPAQQQQEAQQ